MYEMDVDSLIAAVYKRPILWNQKSTGHRNVFVLKRLWAEVADELGTTGLAVRTKWKALRDTYRRETSTRGDETYWAHYKSLSFLKGQFRNIKPPDASSPAIEEEDSLLEDPLKPEIVYHGITTTEHQYESSEAISNSQEEEPRTSRNSVRDSTVKRCVSTGPVRRQRRQVIGNADEDRSFFNSLLPHIKRLSPRKKMLLRLKMQELVYNFVYSSGSMEEISGER